MLTSLFQIKLVALLAQVIFVFSMPIVSYGKEVIEIQSPEVLLSITLLLVFNVSLIFVLRKYEPKFTLGDCASVKPPNTLILIVISLFAIVWFLSPKLGAAATLNGSRDVSGLGVLFKLSTVVIPAFVFSIVVQYPKYLTSYLSFAIGLSASCYAAAAFLTKQPVFPYLLFGFAIFGFLNKKARVLVLALFALLMFAIVFIYSTRAGETVGYAYIFQSIVFRFPMLLEMVSIIIHLFDNEPLWEPSLWKVTGEITYRIFGYDPTSIGIAPGFLGYFLVNFGILGFPILISLGFIYLSTLRSIVGKSIIFKFAYFILICEYLGFFNDGNPSFYTSTNHGAMFYLVIIGVFTLLLIKNVKPSQD